MKKILFLLLSPIIFYAQDVDFDNYNNWLDPSQTSMKITTVKDNIYMIEGIGGGFGNVGVFVGQNGIIMIDNSFEILEELLNDINLEVPDSSFSHFDVMAKSFAKTLSIKTGTQLSEKEQESLVNNLFSCKEHLKR